MTNIPSWMKQAFPLLQADSDPVCSDPTEEYNCIAFAAGVRDEWWQHFPGYRWPASTRSPYISSLIEVFATLGYEICNDGSPEESYEKVALYARDGRWKHAAHQREDGVWESKLGESEDIEHLTAEMLEGELYGEVQTYMRRPTATT